MSINNTLAALEFAQVGWVVPDIYASVAFLSKTLGIAFPEPQQMSAQELKMNYRGEMVTGEWLTTQTYNGGTFLELVQPLSGQSMFHDYLAQYPMGGTQHLAFRLKEQDMDRVIGELIGEGYEIISKVNHPIARMVFFDTYETLGVATEIMGITPEGWAAIQQMKS
jgi:methylmalonyl-CoA/ethylmalonyl-CoA epimerase